MIRPGQQSVVVLVPCYNEETTIAKVVNDFRDALPAARVIVYDNNSTDKTATVAAGAGAEVHTENRQGKGNVVRRMFADIDADIYVMVDGDATYDAASAPAMIKALIEGNLDMVVARRRSIEDAAYPSGHQFGNRLLTGAVAWIFGHLLTDILSGLRVFSRRFVKSFPALASRFETETELTIHALQMRLPVKEIDTPYYARPRGSESKLNTWRDGFRILGTIVRLFVLEKPFQFFSMLSMLFLLASSMLFVPVLLEYFTTGEVARFPSLIVAIGGYIAALVSLIMGTLLYTTAVGRLEIKRFQYLNTDRKDAG